MLLHSQQNQRCFTQPVKAALVSDVAGVEGSGLGGIRGALDDGAAVGEEGQLVRLTGEFQDIFVVADSSVRLQAGGHAGEVYCLMAFVDLDGIAAAERYVSSGCVIEIGEVSFVAYAASGARVVGGDFGAVVGPEILGKQGAAHCLIGADKEFQGLRRGDRGNQVDHWAENTGGVAGLDYAAWCVGEDAGQACGLAGKNVKGGGVASDCGKVNPGHGIFDRVIVDEVAGLEIIGAIEDQVDVGEESVGILGGEIGDAGLDRDLRIETRDLTGCGYGLGEGLAGVMFVEQKLALQIAGLDVIAVDDAQESHAGAGEKRCQDRARGAASDDGYAGRGEFVLTFGADGGEEDLAGIAVVEAWRHWLRLRACSRGVEARILYSTRAGDNDRPLPFIIGAELHLYFWARRGIRVSIEAGGMA